MARDDIYIPPMHIHLMRDYRSDLERLIARGGRLSEFESMIRKQGKVILFNLPQSGHMLVHILKQPRGNILVKFLLRKLSNKQAEVLLKTLPESYHPRADKDDKEYWKFMTMYLLDRGADPDIILKLEPSLRGASPEGVKLWQSWIRQWLREMRPIFERRSQIAMENNPTGQYAAKGISEIVGAYMGFRRSRKRSSRKKKSRRNSRRKNSRVKKKSTRKTSKKRSRRKSRRRPRRSR